MGQNDFVRLAVGFLEQAIDLLLCLALLLFLGTFHPEGVNQGKDRYGVMPPVLVDPTMDRVIAYMRGELTSDEDPRQRVLSSEEVTPETDEPKTPARKPARPIARKPIPKRK